MKIVKILKIGAEMLKLMSDNDIKLDDYKFIDLVEEYERMRNNGDKYWYAIKFLSEKYGLSEASCCRIIRRLGGSVNV